MERARADAIYTSLQKNNDGGYEARCSEGWHACLPGDAINFGDGVIVSIDGPSQIGGGSLKACAAAVLAVLVGVVAAGIMGIGKGVGS